MSQIFSTKIYDDESARWFPAAVEYDYADMGVMMRHNEKMEIVLRSVVVNGREIIEGLDDVLETRLKDEAAGDWIDRKDFWRFGGEDL